MMFGEPSAKEQWDAFTQATNSRDLETLRASATRFGHLGASPRKLGGQPQSSPGGVPRRHEVHPNYHPPSFHTDPQSTRRLRPDPVAKPDTNEDKPRELSDEDRLYEEYE